jgi:hypothetical protein
MCGFSQPSKWSIESTERSEVEQYTRALHFLDHHLQKAGITADGLNDFENLNEKIRIELRTEMRVVKVKEEKFWRFGKENPDVLVGSEAEVWRMVDREITSNKENLDPVRFLMQRVKFDSILKVDDQMRLSRRLRLPGALSVQSNIAITSAPTQTPTINATSNPTQHPSSPDSTDPSPSRSAGKTEPSLSVFLVVPAAILAALIVGIVLLILRRKSK